MDLYDLNNKLKIVRERSFLFLQIDKLTLKIYSNQQNLNISYYLKSQTPMCHRQFFEILYKNEENLEYFCNDSNNLFHFACQKWINQLK